MKILKYGVLALLCAAAATGGARAVQSAVGQKGKMFAPEELSRAKGDLVRIDNDDNIPHNVMVTPPGGDRKNLGLQMPGDHAEIPVDQVGDYQVICGIHPKMKLVVHVQ